jgi:hypothetical protein
MVLTGFRQRFVNLWAEEKILNLVLARLAELGMVKAGDRQRTDLHEVYPSPARVPRLLCCPRSQSGVQGSVRMWRSDYLFAVVAVGSTYEDHVLAGVELVASSLWLATG